MAVREILDQARKQYTAMYGEEAPAVTLDQKNFLPPPPVDLSNSEIDSWCVH
jgi:V-type H+-transporting ATPase subunit E